MVKGLTPGYYGHQQCWQLWSNVYIWRKDQKGASKMDKMVGLSEIFPPKCLFAFFQLTAITIKTKMKILERKLPEKNFS